MHRPFRALSEHADTFLVVYLGICRGLANIAEEFHHARPSYIMLTPSQLVEDVWCVSAALYPLRIFLAKKRPMLFMDDRYVVPQLILLGNLLFPILVYGYFTSSVHSRGAATLVLELAGMAISSALVAHVVLVPYVLQLEIHPAVSGAGENHADIDHGAAAVASVATYWIVSWVLQLALLVRYDTAPGDLEECASERLRLALENHVSAKQNLMSLSTVEEEAAALLEPSVGEAVEGFGDTHAGSTGRTSASFMVARTAICADPLATNATFRCVVMVSAVAAT